MQSVEKVRLKATSPLSMKLNIPHEAQGSVLCRYRLLRGVDPYNRRLDVQFGPHLVVWGAPDDQFETVEDDNAEQPATD